MLRRKIKVGKWQGVILHRHMCMCAHGILDKIVRESLT